MVTEAPTIPSQPIRAGLCDSKGPLGVQEAHWPAPPAYHQPAWKVSGQPSPPESWPRAEKGLPLLSSSTFPVAVNQHAMIITSLCAQSACRVERVWGFSRAYIGTTLNRRWKTPVRLRLTHGTERLVRRRSKGTARSVSGQCTVKVAESQCGTKG